MGANPSDKNSFKCESDYRYNPVVITFHIEHKPAISHTIYRIERVLHFRKIAPISFPVVIVMPEKSALLLSKDRFYPVSDFEITDIFIL
jgi:hypothetical protein